MIKSIQTRFDFFPYLQWRRYDNPSGLYDPIDNGIELLFIEGLLEDYSIRTFQNTNRVLDSTTLSTYSDYKFGAFVNEKMLMPQVGFPGLFELKNCTRTQFSKYAEYKWDPIVFGPVSEDLPPFQTLVGLYKNYSALEDFSGSVYTPTIYINQESRISSFTGTSKIGSIVIHGYTSGGFDGTWYTTYALYKWKAAPFYRPNSPYTMYHLIPYLVITSDVDLDMTTSLFTLDGNFDYVSEIENTDLHKYFVQCPYIWKFDYFDTIDTDPDYFFPPRGMNPLNITELGQVKWDIFYANILKQTHKGLLVGLPDPQTVHDNQLQLWSMLERLFPCVDYDAIAFKIEFDNPIIVKAGETFSFTPKVKVKR